MVSQRKALVEGLRRAVVDAGDGVVTAYARDAMVRAVEDGADALEKTYTRPAEEVPRLELCEGLREVVKAVGRGGQRRGQGLGAAARCVSRDGARAGGAGGPVCLYGVPDAVWRRRDV